MKPPFFIALGVIFILVAAGAVVAALLVEDDKFGDVVLATGIRDDTSAPIDDVTEFEAGTTAVYATLKVQDLDAGETLKFEWQGEGDEEPIETELSLPNRVDDEVWVYSVLEKDTGFPPGNYHVDVHHGGDLLERKEFSVAE